MPNSTEFIAHVLELMRPAATATARAMFGGHGVYVNGIIVAIVTNDIVYFKTDDANREEFAALGMEPFNYVTKEGDRHLMSYHRAPDEVLESPASMALWLRSALGAALRRANAKPAPRKPRAPRGPS